MEIIEKKKKVTVEEYLAMEAQAEYRSEYYDGDVIDMSGGSSSHSIITINCAVALHPKLAERDCLVYGSDMKLAVDEAKSFFHPDLMVVCGKPEFEEKRNDRVKNPILIIEVLSPSTESYDRGKKFYAYRKLASFKEYVLVSQDEHRVERFYRRDENIWQIDLVEGLESTLKLESLGIEIPLSDIYAKVNLGE